jgi:calcineurin-like phosphoesterase family protein
VTGDLFAKQTWWTADLHLGHQRIIELCDRPFETVDEMNRAIVDRWNERVEPDDTVMVLGDFALGTIAETLALTSLLHGHKILVAGNHDRCFHGFKGNGGDPAKLAEWVGRYRAAGFASVVTGAAARRAKFLDQALTWALRPAYGEPHAFTVQVSHFPRTGESEPANPDRYSEYRPRPVPRKREEPWLLHGHVHNAWTIHGRQVNVGVDVWDFAPVSSETLIRLLTEGMPTCDCTGEDHQMGAPGCVLNGG